MSDVEVSTLIAASPDEVWTVLTDVGRVGEWLTVHEHFHDAPDTLREGSQLEQRVSSGDIGADVEWSVECLDPPCSMTWAGTATGGAKLRTTYRLVADDGGTRVECETDFSLPGGLLGAIAAKVAEPRGTAEAGESLDRLRALVETGG